MLVRVLGASSDWGWKDEPLAITKYHIEQGTNKMMHANIHPSNQIFLCDILSVEETMEINGRGSWQVKVPHAARRWFGLLATGNSQIVARPVRVL